MECSVCHVFTHSTVLISTKKGAYNVCKGCKDLGVWDDDGE
jgi:Pyruvate/2-oxoacid:ferredoxin oxidoreductase delta subunit